jgi:hypothetical protein
VVDRNLIVCLNVETKHIFVGKAGLSASEYFLVLAKEIKLKNEMPCNNFFFFLKKGLIC